MSEHLSPLVEAISQLHREGNILHSAWFQTIRLPSGKADLIAINLLAEVIYWYTKVEIRHEGSGRTIGYRKKFQADLWQASYDGLAEKFGLSKRQVSDAIERLEKQHHAVLRVFRTIQTKSGLTLGNVLFLQPLPAGIIALSSPTSGHSERDPSGVQTSEGSRLNVRGPAFKRQTYTDIPTETSTSSLSERAASFDAAATDGESISIEDIPLPNGHQERNQPQETVSIPSAPSLLPAEQPQETISNRQESKAKAAPPADALAACQLIVAHLAATSETIPPTPADVTRWAWALTRFQTTNNLAWQTITDVITWACADSYWASRITSGLLFTRRQTWNTLVNQKKRLHQAKAPAHDTRRIQHQEEFERLRGKSVRIISDFEEPNGCDPRG